MAKSSIKIPESVFNLDNTVLSAVKKGVSDITEDLLRVATERSPVASKTLEQSGTSTVSATSKKIQGTVSFEAYNKGFNYAKVMNEKKYNLGEKSMRKSSRGVRSKFSKSSFTVGTGFLTDSALKCEEGYVNHVNSKVQEAMKRAGFKTK